MSEERFLEEGDVIELKEGMTVYATLPQHFFFQNRIGTWDLDHGRVRIGGHTAFVAGHYIVHHTGHDGGDGTYPDGYHVYCKRAPSADPLPSKAPLDVDFYQSGCFTATITPAQIQPIGKARQTWVLEKDDE